MYCKISLPAVVTLQIDNFCLLPSIFTLFFWPSGPLSTGLISAPFFNHLVAASPLVISVSNITSCSPAVTVLVSIFFVN